MKQNTTRGINLYRMISLFLTLFFITTLNAQRIHHTTDENFFAYFSIIDTDETGEDTPYLNPGDLVYYHFSDGISLQAVSHSDNPNATVKRRFKNIATPRVLAYVARKNGPLKFASTIVVNDLPVCQDCNNPLTLMPDDLSIKLSTSWTPFVSSDLTTFNHDITNPSFPTPTEAWFFLNLHLEKGALVEINIPEAFSVYGVSIDDNWSLLTPGAPPLYGLALDSEFKSIEYTSNDKINIELFDTPINDQAQLSLLLVGNPGDYLYTIQKFQSTLFMDKEKTKFEKHDLRVQVSANPHDPNKITPKETFVCSHQSESPFYTYTVDFQNLGEGYAEHVEVIIDIDETRLDAFSLNTSDLNSTHTISSIDVESDQIIFTLNDINLPGLTQQYPVAPSLEDTKGRIRFKLKTQPCLGVFGSSEAFLTSGLIKFICCFEDGEYFVENTPMNQAEQKLSFCGFDPACMDDIPDGEYDIGIISGTGTPYPNPFNDQVSVDLNFDSTSGPIEIRITDANGIVRESQIVEQPNMGQVVQLDTNNLPPGTYFVSIITATEVITYMVVKQ